MRSEKWLRECSTMHSCEERQWLVLRWRKGGREGEKKEEKTKAESDDRGIKGEREVNGQVNGALQCQHSHLRGRESVGIYQCNT